MEHSLVSTQRPVRWRTDLWGAEGHSGAVFRLETKRAAENRKLGCRTCAARRRLNDIDQSRLRGQCRQRGPCFLRSASDAVRDSVVRRQLVAARVRLADWGVPQAAKYDAAGCEPSHLTRAD